jgi:hypothetical protein
MNSERLRAGTSAVYALAMSSVASLPGGIRVQYAHLLRCRPTLLWRAILGVVLLGAGVTVAIARPAWRDAAGAVIALGMVFVARFLNALKVEKMRFSRGMLLPGVVLSPAPLRLAVLADMSKDPGRRFDVVAVRDYPSCMLEPGLMRGHRVPFCALFGAGRAPLAAHWMRFQAEPVSLASCDPAVLREAVSRIPKSEWAALAAAARSCPDEPGTVRRVDVSLQTGQPSGWPPDWVGRDLNDGEVVV